MGMNFDYFDVEESSAPQINSPDQIRDEMSQLREIADKLGSYRWTYKEDFATNKGIDTNEHFGPVAQQLLEIPGLSGAVMQGPDGTLQVNTNYAALAALGLVAALARVVLGSNKEEEINDTNTELSGTVPDNTGSTADNTGEAFPGDTGSDNGSASETLQPSVATEETVMDDGSSASNASASGAVNETDNTETY